MPASWRAKAPKRGCAGADQGRGCRRGSEEVIYHTNRIEGSPLTLPEVGAIVEAFWAEQNGQPKSQQQHQSSSCAYPSTAAAWC